MDSERLFQAVCNLRVMVGWLFGAASLPSVYRSPRTAFFFSAHFSWPGYLHCGVEEHHCVDADFIWDRGSIDADAVTVLLRVRYRLELQACSCNLVALTPVVCLAVGSTGRPGADRCHDCAETVDAPRMPSCCIPMHSSTSLPKSSRSASAASMHCPPPPQPSCGGNTTNIAAAHGLHCR